MVNSNLVSDPKEASDALSDHFSKILSEDSFRQDLRNAAKEKECPDFGTTNSEYYNVSLLCRN